VPGDESQGTESLLKYAELLLRKGMHEEACVQLQEVLRRDPECARAHYTLAVVHASEGLLEESAGHFQEAVRLSPGEAKYWNGLGVVLQRLGRIEQAAACYREAVHFDPRYQDAQVNLALLLKDHGRLCAAERQLEQAIAIQPDSVRLRYNFANVLHLQGRSLDAVAAYREVLRLDPEHLDARQNLLFALHYSPQFSDRQIFEEHLAAAGTKPFTQQSFSTVNDIPTYPNSPSSLAGEGRGEGQVLGSLTPRIRIGYLSPDFRSHAVASFIEPILTHHDRTRFEVFCYANLARPDQTTERLKGLADDWRDISQKGDPEAARLIADDRIDILIDLAGHTSGNRLPLLARKPAPIQVTWIGYPDTTGIPALDFRITDGFADPPGTTEHFHSEQLIRLPRTFSCYLPPETSPEVAAPPSLAVGKVTFGSFNNLAKVTPEVIALWARVLQAVPGSRMLMKCRPLEDAEVCARILELFQVSGVPADRIELHPGDPSPADHLAQYGRVDIALDTFPYNGTTTSCEALWMGVPVVTLAGTRHAARTGVSILSNCELDSLVARTPEEYLEIACELARDGEKLQELRAGMRERMRNSPLTDAAGVTRELEEVYTGMLERGK
jgi:protein O-GlcNAc transferase